MENQDLGVIQQKIGYRFRNLDLLQQAFVRRSYSEENGGENNEVLEFIGDKVLDFIVVKLLSEKYGFMLGDCDDFDENEEFNEFACERNEAELTEIKRQLVQKKNLAQRIEVLELSRYLIVGNGDHSQNESSVKEDLFEAIIGAAAIDSNWNMEELENLVDVMLSPDTIIEDSEEDYITLIQVWTAKKGIGTPAYHFEKGSFTSTWYIPSNTIDQYLDIFKDRELISEVKFYCLMKISNEMKPFRGFGRSKLEARRNACATAYNHLRQQGLLTSIRDEIPAPSKEQAINQLEILARRGYFSIPVYTFLEKYDQSGNPIWHCRCSIKEKNQTFSADSSSKKDAKKIAAFRMLQHVLDL